MEKHLKGIKTRRTDGKRKKSKGGVLGEEKNFGNCSEENKVLGVRGEVVSKIRKERAEEKPMGWK